MKRTIVLLVMVSLTSFTFGQYSVTYDNFVGGEPIYANQVDQNFQDLVLACNELKAQIEAMAVGLWSEGTGGAIYYTGGNVGIGTTEPVYPLTVAAGSVANYAQTWISSNGNDGARLYVDGATGLGNEGVFLSLGDPSSSTYVTKIMLDSRTGNNSYFNNGGNVGIGTMEPDTAMLDVASALNGLRLRAGNAGEITDNQIIMSYNGSLNYSHAIKTRHNSGAETGNSIDFYVWDQGGDANTDIGTKHVMSLNGGNVGIGTTNPGAPLEVSTTIEIGTWFPIIVGLTPNMGIGSHAEIRVGKEVSPKNYGFMGFYYAGDESLDNRLDFGFYGTGEIMSIAASGNVGIGIDSPSHILHIDGQGRATSSSWATSSDIRLKDVSGSYPFGLREITLLNPIRFSYKDGNQLNLPADEAFIGISAQEVESIIPEAVKIQEDGYRTVNNDPIIWAMVNAIKELKAQNDELLARIEAMEAAIE